MADTTVRGNQLLELSNARPHREVAAGEYAAHSFRGGSAESRVRKADTPER